MTAFTLWGVYPTEYRLSYKEFFLIWAAGAEASSRTKVLRLSLNSHFDSTSREVSYSVQKLLYNNLHQM